MLAVVSSIDDSVCVCVFVCIKCTPISVSMFVTNSTLGTSISGDTITIIEKSDAHTHTHTHKRTSTPEVLPVNWNKIDRMRPADMVEICIEHLMSMHLTGRFYHSGFYAIGSVINA